MGVDDERDAPPAAPPRYARSNSSKATGVLAKRSFGA